MTRGLVELFANPFGQPVLRTNIQRLTLPAVQRRALALANAAVLLGALSEDQRPLRRIEVELTNVTPTTMRLRTVLAARTPARLSHGCTLQGLVALLDEGSIQTSCAFGHAEIAIQFRVTKPESDASMAVD